MGWVNRCRLASTPCESRGQTRHRCESSHLRWVIADARPNLAPTVAVPEACAMTHMNQYIIPAGRMAREAAPGIEQRGGQARQPQAGPPALRRAREGLSQARPRPLPLAQVAGDGGDARHLLCAPLAALGPRARPARPGRAARHGAQPLLLLLPRDMAAGVLLRHRPFGAGGAYPVPDHLHRRPRVVRLHVSANGVDRSDDRGRALLAGRPQRPHRSRQAQRGGRSRSSGKA